MVRPFAKRLVDFQVSEPLVDCGRCGVRAPLERSEGSRPYKCCTFQPFWSLFQVGEFLQEDIRRLEATGVTPARPQLPALPEGSLFLPVGIVPPAGGRAKLESVKAEERHQREDLLCSHFQKDTRECGIFAYRPLECRRYYCASQFQPSHDKLFQWASNLEMSALKTYLLSQCGYSLEDWDNWVQYLEPGGWRLDVPQAALSETQALDFYLKAAPWWTNYHGRVEAPDAFVVDPQS